MPSPTTIRYWKKKAVLLGMESAYGSDPTLVAADWFEARNVVLTPYETESQERNIALPWMGNSGKLITAVRKKLSFDVALAASGTQGVAPKIGKLLRAGGFAETLNVLNSGTATAGAASAITLAAGASAVDDTYNGMSIVITAGTGSGQSRVVSDYVGATKVATVSEAWATEPDATSVYSIRDKVEYTLVGEDFESVAFYVEIDKVKHVGLGVRVNPQPKMDAKGAALLGVECMALYAIPSDTLPLSIDRSGWPYERPVNAANTLVCKVNAVDSFYSKFGVNVGNQLVHGIYAGGYEEIKISDRKPSANITILAPTLATFNPYALAGDTDTPPTNIAVQIVHGASAGNKVQVDLKAIIVNVNEVDVDGMAGYDLTLSPEPVTGDDEIKLTFL